MKKLVSLSLFCFFSLTLFSCQKKLPSLDESARSKLGGTYKKLSHGYVHYELEGPAEGTPIVLVHGFSVPSFVWDKNFQYFVSRGFKVLRYDLYGRGFSARPNVKYNLELFSNQLEELVETLNFPKPFHLVGLSMGTGVSLQYTLKNKNYVKDLTLISPIGMPVNVPLTAQLVKIPNLGLFLFDLLGDVILEKGIAKNFYDENFLMPFLKKFNIQRKYDGYNAALISTLLNVPLHDLETSYLELAKSKTKTQVIWGENDQITPYRNNVLMSEYLPNAKIHTIKKAGHLPQYEKHDEVNELLINFIGSTTSQ